MRRASVYRGRKTAAAGRLLALWAAALAVVLSGPVRAAEVLTLATTTSTENSGLLSHIHPAFEKATGARVKVVAKGTGASLQLARDGNADVILVHARAREDAFVAQGHGVMRRDVMYNDFVLIGPAADPAGIKGLRSASEALARIAAGKATFVSRGDGSGTHIKEQELWRKSGPSLEEKSVSMVVKGKTKTFASVRPKGDWYLAVGQGMGKTIILTTEKQAYTMTDRGTYWAFALADPPKTDLAVLCEGDSLLGNPYGVIAVNPEKHPHVNFDVARKYIEWITSPHTQQMIGSYTFRGKVLFFPNAGK